MATYIEITNTKAIAIGNYAIDSRNNVCVKEGFLGELSNGKWAIPESVLATLTAMQENTTVNGIDLSLESTRVIASSEFVIRNMQTGEVV